MTTEQLADRLAQIYYAALHAGDASPPWERLPGHQREKHRRAARSLLADPARPAAGDGVSDWPWGRARRRTA